MAPEQRYGAGSVLLTLPPPLSLRLPSSSSAASRQSSPLLILTPGTLCRPLRAKYRPPSPKSDRRQHSEPNHQDMRQLTPVSDVQVVLGHYSQPLRILESSLTVQYRQRPTTPASPDSDGK